jgi:hypothetical protein
MNVHSRFSIAMAGVRQDSGSERATSLDFEARKRETATQNKSGSVDRLMTRTFPANGKAAPVTAP